jgi:hypothetical protein
VTVGDYHSLRIHSKNNLREKRVVMSRQNVQKRGMASGSKKTASTRHPFDAAPSTSPTHGAFGKEAEPVMPDGKERQVARDTERKVPKRRG